MCLIILLFFFDNIKMEQKNKYSKQGLIYLALKNGLDYEKVKMCKAPLMKRAFYAELKNSANEEEALKKAISGVTTNPTSYDVKKKELKRSKVKIIDALKTDK